ncbi:MAG: hypothetical protein IMY78_00630 [Chloroflexi bacterium]|jgi:hypothetical protein|nr:hypothetical protein [Chloroflexota bacterium]
MSVFDDFIAVVKRTETIQAVLRSLEEDPARLLGSICKEYESTGKSVPDHHLHLGGYFGEAVLRALISASLITKDPGDRYALYSYKPTEVGINYYKGMLAEKKI